jgi:hypothetical protein
MLHTPPLTQNQKTIISSLHIKEMNTTIDGNVYNGKRTDSPPPQRSLYENGTNL